MIVTINALANTKLTNIKINPNWTKIAYEQAT